MNVQEIAVSELIPYENNPRNNLGAVDAVAESIRNFGFKVPIVIDSENVIVCGHTRLMAAKKLGLDKVPCIVADDLTDEQIKAFRLADNKTAELAEWDFSKLEAELAELADVDMSVYGFCMLCADEPNTEQKYTTKVNIPQYEIQGEQPSIYELYDATKTSELIREIEQAEISEDDKEFLKRAAQRHTVFNYRKIAEYYANANDDVKKLMEKSALVIIDLENAIANGYAKLSDRLQELRENESA